MARLEKDIKKEDKVSRGGPLEGIKVLDWTHHNAGPFAGAMLGDLGAEVVLVEPPGVGDSWRRSKNSLGAPNSSNGRNMMMEDLNRNKKGITVNRDSEEGRQILYELARKVDVFLTNAADPERWGMGYDRLSSLNPRLVYGRITGGGRKGPDVKMGGHEYFGYARSGAFMAAPSDGQTLGNPPLGLGARMASIMMAYAVLGALLARERTGRGQEIDVSLLGSWIFLQGTVVMRAIWAGQELEPATYSNNSRFGTYKCGDGKGIFVDTGQNWPLVCKALKRTDLLEDPRFKDEPSRQQHSKELGRILNQIFATGTYDEWRERLISGGGADNFAPMNSLSDLQKDPQVLANGAIVEWDHPDLGKMPWVGFGFDLSETPARFRAAAPLLGEHTEHILKDWLGYDQQRIADLKARKVI